MSREIDIKNNLYVVVSWNNLALRFGPMKGPEAGKILAELMDYKVNLVLICDCGPEFDMESFLALTGVSKLTDEEKKEKVEKAARILAEG